MNLIKKLIISVIFSNLLLSTAFSDDSTTDLQYFLNNWRIQKKVPGVILLIKTPTQHNIFTSGTTRLNGDERITENTLFAVGSITKTFTSAMILRLEAEGKLNINDKIGHYFPQYLAGKILLLNNY